jgi:hypothetical protein
LSSASRFGSREILPKKEQIALRFSARKSDHKLKQECRRFAPANFHEAHTGVECIFTGYVAVDQWYCRQAQSLKDGEKKMIPVKP